jgi:hypothetical protein
MKPEGGSVYLYSICNNQTSLVDSVVFGLQIKGSSIGWDATQGRWTLNRLTPGTANDPAVLASPYSLRINEWMALPKQGDDWFELHNTNSLPVGLEGLLLSDRINQSQPTCLPPLSFIGANSQGYAVFYADEQSGKGANHVAFKLSGDGDSIALLTPDHQFIDLIAFAGQQKGVSQGRYPDGGAWTTALLDPASPGYSNRIAPGQEDLDHDGAPDGWEIAYGFDATNPADAFEDRDHDGLSNLQEFQCGTNPLDASSLLSFKTIKCHDGKLLLSFWAVAGKIYIVQYVNQLGPDVWQNLFQFGPFEANQYIECADIVPPSGKSRYYRLVLADPKQ